MAFKKQTFKKSDLKKVEILSPVVLKSGGPIMSLDRIDAEQAICTWKDDNKVQTAIFGPSMLYKCIPVGNTFKKLEEANGM